MQETNIQPAAEFRQCFKCNYEAITDRKVCPKCGKKAFFTSSSIRKRGIVALIMGLFLIGLMVGISIVVGSLLLGQMKNPESAKKIADDQVTFVAIFGLFGLLIGLGLQFVVTGGWMAAFGKRNRILVWIMLALVFIVIFAASFLTVFLT